MTDRENAAAIAETTLMLSLEDCIALCGLTPDEVAAIAEHEHVPEIEAAALARKLMAKAHGEENLRDMIVDDIRAAVRGGRLDHATELFAALRHFLRDHPHAQPGSRRE